MPTSPHAQLKGFPDVHYLPVTQQKAQDGSYNNGLSMEAGYPSPNFSSPGFSSQASPGPFKSLEEVKSFHEMKQEDAVSHLNMPHTALTFLRVTRPLLKAVLTCESFRL